MKRAAGAASSRSWRTRKSKKINKPSDPRPLLPRARLRAAVEHTRLAKQNLRIRFRYAREPWKGESPKAPALTVPEIASPSTCAENFRVMAMGEVISIDQVALPPSTAPF